MIGSSDATQNCDCSKFSDPILKAGCENFLSLKWNNVNVTYEGVSCPLELDRLPCWEDNSDGWPVDDIPEFCAANIDGPPTTVAPQTSSPTVMPAVVTSTPAAQPTPPPVPTATSPPFADGNIATTTRYWDCSGGGCGCGYLAGGDTSKETHCHGYVQLVFLQLFTFYFPCSKRNID